MEIAPTLNDEQVMRFVFDGYIKFESLIPASFNETCRQLPGGRLTEFVNTEEFRSTVFLHPEVAGVARSLLGEDFLVPSNAHHHLYEEPHTGQTWHSDGLTEEGHGVNHLQCFYYPQAVGPEDGPTMVLPGSHYRIVDREAIAHYGNIRGQLPLTVPAGTVVMTKYGLWHKAGAKLNTRRRGMIKFSYFRASPPKRDWIGSSGETPVFVAQGRHPYATEVESYRDLSRCKRTWNWLCGLDEEPGDVAHGAKMFVSAVPVKQAVKG